MSRNWWKKVKNCVSHSLTSTKRTLLVALGAGCNDHLVMKRDGDKSEERLWFFAFRLSVVHVRVIQQISVNLHLFLILFPNTCEFDSSHDNVMTWCEYPGEQLLVEPAGCMVEVEGCFRALNRCLTSGALETQTISKLSIHWPRDFYHCASSQSHFFQTGQVMLALQIRASDWKGIFRKNSPHSLRDKGAVDGTWQERRLHAH